MSLHNNEVIATSFMSQEGMSLRLVLVEGELCSIQEEHFIKDIRNFIGNEFLLVLLFHWVHILVKIVALWGL